MAMLNNQMVIHNIISSFIHFLHGLVPLGPPGPPWASPAFSARGAVSDHRRAADAEAFAVHAQHQGGGGAKHTWR